MTSSFLNQVKRQRVEFVFPWFCNGRKFFAKDANCAKDLSQ